ncbi:MAG: IS481 family transposase [Nitrospinota bacterium]
MRVRGWEGALLRAGGLGVELSPRARERLQALSLWRETGDVGLVSRTFGLSRATLYRWRARFEPMDLSTLEERSRRPRRVRRPQWSPELAEGVLRLRRQYPRWGKMKLAVLLEREGLAASPSTVGRILRYLKGRGRLGEPRLRRVSAQRRRPPRPYATRKPRDYQPARPGDLVQVDTLDLRPLPGVTLKQFTARDVASRWDVLEAFGRASAHCARKFLDTLQARAPFPIRAIQVDGGGEFRAEFEAECARKGIRLFELPPRSPKLNGAVERAQRTHAEEFYEVEDLPWTLRELNARLRQWEHTYNHHRPHQALGYLTPAEALAKLQAQASPSHMS